MRAGAVNSMVEEMWVFDTPGTYLIEFEAAAGVAMRPVGDATELFVRQRSVNGIVRVVGD
jgi:hypothetical protein